LTAGRHVLSQKPFVLDLDDGERLAALARDRGVHLAVNQNGRWAPHFAWMAAAVRAGVIGEVATVDFSLQWDHTWTAGTAFEEIRHLVLFDFGVHWFDMATQLLPGAVAERVTATVARAPFQAMKPPLLAQVAVACAGAQVRMSFNGHVRHGQRDVTTICGSKGTLRSEGPSLSEQQVWLETAAGRTAVPLEGTWFTSGFQGTMGELLGAVDERRAPSHAATSVLPGLAWCFAAMASADAGGQPVVPGRIRQAPR
jgi:predicted dehydrogenase